MCKKKSNVWLPVIKCYWAQHYNIIILRMYIDSFQEYESLIFETLHIYMI